MQSRGPYPAQRRSRFILSVCVLILLGMLFGTMVSSMGGVTSHSLAEFAAGQHKIEGILVDAHGHSHDDDGAKPAFSDAGADHPHHSADHTHDKSHVPSSAMTVAISIADSRPTTGSSGWRRSDWNALPWLEIPSGLALPKVAPLL